MSTKPAPSFEVVFRGSELYPESIPLNHLSRALAAVQRLAGGSPESRDDEEGESETAPRLAVRLLNVRRGSAIYPCVSDFPKEAIENLREAGRVLRNHVENERIAYALTPIETLSDVAKKLDCSITIRDNDGNDLATIESQSYERVASSLLVAGETTLSGYVQRAGGASSMRCAIRIPSQPHLLFCRVETQDAVRELGKRLYQLVDVSGQGLWIKGSWRVVSFTVQTVREARVGGTLRDAIRAVREAGGKDWDQIDNPKAFLRSVTGD